MNVAGAPDLRKKIYPSCEELDPSSILAINPLTSGLPLSAVVARMAIAETDASVPLFKRTSPAVPGSAIEVELSNVYFHANAPADASLLTADAALAVAEFPEFVAWVLAVEAEVEASPALVVAIAACAVEITALAVEITACAVDVLALAALAVALVLADAASTNKTHLAESVLELMGTDPELVCAVIHR